MRIYHLALVWYLTTVSALFFATLLLLNLSQQRTISSPVAPKYQIYKSLPASAAYLNSQEINFIKNDARVLIVENFFKGYKAPLAAHASTFVKVADKYGLDFRLMPAISMQESNGGKRMPKESNNPFGYGIYGGLVLRFDDFDLAIERVGKGLKQDYIDQGLKNPEEIMAKYTPPALAKGGDWAINVSGFMNELR